MLASFEASLVIGNVTEHIDKLKSDFTLVGKVPGCSLGKLSKGLVCPIVCIGFECC